MVIINLEEMKAPKTCSECFAYNNSCQNPYCSITLESRAKGFKYKEKKMDNCPLLDITECYDCKYGEGDPYAYWICIKKRT